MTVYLNENFDTTSVGSLPTGWSSQGGTVAVSNTVSFSGSNSLKLTNSSTGYVLAWLASATDSNYGLVQASMKFYYDGAPSATFAPAIFLLCTSAPSGGNLPDTSQNCLVSLYSSGSGIQFLETNSTGTTNTAYSGTIAQATLNTGPAFAIDTWYEMTFIQTLSLDGIYIRTNLFIQRLSDSAWLHRDGTWQTGVQTSVLSFIGLFATTNFPAWQNGTFVCFGGDISSGVNLYLDDCVFQSAPAATGPIPSNPPAPGNEVELIPTITVSDSGQSGQGISQINTTNFEAQYISLGSYDQWILLDAGSGNAITPTGLLFAPGWKGAAIFFSHNSSYEAFALGIQVEGASSTSGPWTLIGAWSTVQYPFPHFLNTLRLDPANPGGSYRYLRLRAPIDPVCVSQVYILAQNSGGINYKPARPVLNPVCANLPSGGTVTITTQTSGASIYYTTDGTTPTLSGGVPQGTTTLYTGPVVVPNSAPGQQTVLQAIAYNGSAPTTTSAVTTGYYTVPAKYIFDSGNIGSTLFGTVFSQAQNWPGPSYDSNFGFQIQSNNGGIIQDSTTGEIWQYGNWIDGVYASGGLSYTGIYPRGVWFYKGVSIQGQQPWLNWNQVGQLLPPMPPQFFPTPGTVIANQERPKIIENPSPLNANNKFVICQHIGTGNTSVNGYLMGSAPAMAGPWTWQDLIQPGSLTAYGDSTLFYDVNVDDGTGNSRGKAYICFNDVGNNNFYVFQLDPTNDWLTTTGTGTIVSSLTSQEAPVVFHENGYYFILTSGYTPFGRPTSGTNYTRTTVFPTGTWSGIQSIFASAPANPSVAYAAQTVAVFDVPGLPSKGRILMFCIQDAYENVVDAFHMWQCWLPLSTVTQGNAVNAFPAAGTLSIQAPAAWDASYLPSFVPHVPVVPKQIAEPVFF